MSPILVRPVREQLEHDRVIRQLQAQLQAQLHGCRQPRRRADGLRRDRLPTCSYPDLVLTSLRVGQEARGRDRGRDQRIGEPARSDGAVGAFGPAAGGVHPLRAVRRRRAWPGACAATTGIGVTRDLDLPHRRRPGCDWRRCIAAALAEKLSAARAAARRGQARQRAGKPRPPGRPQAAARRGRSAPPRRSPPRNGQREAGGRP
ncbi:MAG: hypothetical protein MZV64_72720 [Ignavibacteriales bacterium]|nr:hypothetical protein [Ignavibacteriales bacterium]